MKNAHIDLIAFRVVDEGVGRKKIAIGASRKCLNLPITPSEEEETKEISVDHAPSFGLFMPIFILD